MKPLSKTSDDPAISVSAAPINPPVQLSAVAICKPCARARASTSSASFSNSGGNMLKFHHKDTKDTKQGFNAEGAGESRAPQARNVFRVPCASSVPPALNLLKMAS